MRRFCEDSTCRRRFLLHYFGEECEACGQCDICDGGGGETLFDRSEEARFVLLAVKETGGRYGLKVPCDLAGGTAKHEWQTRFSCYGAAKGKFPNVSLKDAGEKLLGAGFLAQRRVDVDSGSYVAVHITDKGEEALASAEPILLPARKAASSATSSALPSDRLARLKRTRLSLADGKPPYVVATDKDLANLIAANPTDLASLERVSGFGPKKVARYGEALLACLHG